MVATLSKFRTGTPATFYKEALGALRSGPSSACNHVRCAHPQVVNGRAYQNSSNGSTNGRSAPPETKKELRAPPFSSERQPRGPPPSESEKRELRNEMSTLSKRVQELAGRWDPTCEDAVDVVFASRYGQQPLPK